MPVSLWTISSKDIERKIITTSLDKTNYLQRKNRSYFSVTSVIFGDPLGTFNLPVLPSRISLTSNVFRRISKRSLSLCNIARVTHMVNKLCSCYGCVTTRTKVRKSIWKKGKSNKFQIKSLHWWICLVILKSKKIFIFFMSFYFIRKKALSLLYKL